MTPNDMVRIHAAAMPDARHWSATEFRDLLKAKGAVAASNAYCFAIGRVTLDEAELILIATDPDAQRQGHAKGVLKDLTEAARAYGAELMFLEVAQSNSAARALYMREGWTETGRRRGYYARKDGSKEDAILMAKFL